MTRPNLEDLLCAFLDRRDASPTMTPEEFAGEHPECGDELLEAIHAALDVERLLPSQEPDELQEIDGYRILGEIGRGGMGIVYRAERDGRSFALKLLPLAPVLGPRILERFRREAATLSELHHPGIVGIHATGVYGEIPYLVMELVEGRPLQQLVKELDAGQAADLMDQVCRTVHAAHEQGVLHRDLKPQNIIVGEDGRAVLLDFGLSVADDLPTLTATGELVGTPRYMAPEQVTGGDLDRRTDVYALGLILFELVTGQPAYGERSRGAVLSAAAAGKTPRPRKVRRGLPRTIERILLMALARNPQRRYQTTLAMAEDLRRFREGTPVAARPPGRLALMGDACRARPWTTATAGLGLAAAAAALLLLPGGREGLSPADARAVRQQMNLATAAWLDADSAEARVQLASVLRIDPENAAARVLDAHLSDSKPAPPADSSMRALADGLRLRAEGNAAGAEARFRSCVDSDLHPALLSALLGESAANRGDLVIAERHLADAAQAMPGCASMQAELAAVYSGLGRFQEAEASFLRAAEGAPSSPEIQRGLAFAHLRQLEFESAMAAAERARELSSSEDGEILRMLAMIHDEAGQRDQARKILHQILANHPDDSQAHYLLGMSYDRDHLIRRAEESYRRAAQLEPSHAEALICLANLHAGALRGECLGCDEAFADNPDLLDLSRAEQYLLRSLQADQGRSEWVIRSAREIALRLKKRDRVISLLEGLISDRERSPATLRLERMLRIIRLTEGKND
ncbi:MAG: protein kinase [Candidatus Eisenbacteria bacterium]|nr:protein kinase [Candidatus Eisenbacteria bacterium]